MVWVEHVIGWLGLQCRRCCCSYIQRAQYHTAALPWEPAAWKQWQPTWSHSRHWLKHQLCRVYTNIGHPSEADKRCDRLPGLRPAHLHLKTWGVDLVLFLHFQLFRIQIPILHFLRTDLITRWNFEISQLWPKYVFCPLELKVSHTSLFITMLLLSRAICQPPASFLSKLISSWPRSPNLNLLRVFISYSTSGNCFLSAWKEDEISVHQHN